MFYQMYSHMRVNCLPYDKIVPLGSNGTFGFFFKENAEIINIKQPTTAILTSIIIIASQCPK